MRLNSHWTASVRCPLLTFSHLNLSPPTYHQRSWIYVDRLTYNVCHEPSVTDAGNPKKQLHYKWPATVHLWTELWFKLLKWQMTISFTDHMISVIYTCIRKFCRKFRLYAPTSCSNIRCSLIQRVYSQCCCAFLCVALQPNRTWFASFLSFRTHAPHFNSCKRIIISSQRLLST